LDKRHRGSRLRLRYRRRLRTLIASAARFPLKLQPITHREAEHLPEQEHGPLPGGQVLGPAWSCCYDALAWAAAQPGDNEPHADRPGLDRKVTGARGHLPVRPLINQPPRR
jgi:hypothetical protein